MVNKVNSVLFGHNSVWSAELEGIHFFEVLDLVGQNVMFSVTPVEGVFTDRKTCRGWS